MTDAAEAGPLRVRLAEKEDLRPLMALLGRMHLEIGFGSIDLQKSTARVASLIEGAVVLVAERDGSIVGSMALQETEWWYSRERYFGDWWTYVVPEARASNAGKLLIDTAKGIARKSGSPLVLATLGGQPERKRLFYRRRGLREIGQTFILET